MRSSLVSINLEDRKQSVTIRGVKSETGDLLWVVPQGSVLGPKLFSISTKPLGDTFLFDKGMTSIGE